MDFVVTNVQGTAILLEVATEYWRGLQVREKESFRFLHVSTDEVYGSLGSTGVFSESTPYRPNSPYAASKAASDHFARSWHRTFGLPVIISHCSNNYGPYQMPEKLIPVAILAALEGRPVPVYGDGMNVRDWLFVEDHVRALESIAGQGAPGRIYNVGADAETTNIEVVRAVCAWMDELVPESRFHPHANLIEFVADRPGHDRRYAIDTSRVRRELDGGRPSTCTRGWGAPFAGISRIAGGGRGFANADSKIGGARVCMPAKAIRCARRRSFRVRKASSGTTCAERTQSPGGLVRSGVPRTRV